MSIELLFQEFEQYAQESHSLLTETLSIISEGKVPSRKDVSQLDLSIANLRAKYDCIYQTASEQLPTDEMPEDGAPAQAYVDAIQNSKTIQLKLKLDQARACSHKNSIKNHSKHDNRKKNNIEFIVTSADFSKTL